MSRVLLNVLCTNESGWIVHNSLGVYKYSTHSIQRDGVFTNIQHIQYKEMAQITDFNCVPINKLI